jgi:hypothetical protein
MGSERFNDVSLKSFVDMHLSSSHYERLSITNRRNLRIERMQCEAGTDNGLDKR